MTKKIPPKTATIKGSKSIAPVVPHQHTSTSGSDHVCDECGAHFGIMLVSLEDQIVMAMALLQTANAKWSSAEAVRVIREQTQIELPEQVADDLATILLALKMVDSKAGHMKIRALAVAMHGADTKLELRDAVQRLVDHAIVARLSVLREQARSDRPAFEQACKVLVRVLREMGVSTTVRAIEKSIVEPRSQKADIARAITGELLDVSNDALRRPKSRKPKLNDD